jgi:zinc protease
LLYSTLDSGDESPHSTDVACFRIATENEALPTYDLQLIARVRALRDRATLSFDVHGGMKPMRQTILIALAVLVVSPALFGAATGPGSEIKSLTLDNGMKVIVWPDHDIPNVAMYIWYRAGGRNEYPGITGISHYFEHMMFNGAKKYGPGEFDRVMEANGGANNAFTANDVTAYQNWFPKSAMEVIFDLEADRISSLAFDPEIVESERGVVYSERRLRTDNSNIGALYEQVQATAFVAHPYQFPVIGWPSDIERWTMEDLQNYFKTYYAPNNATMIVVGDVTPDEVFALAKTYIGPIPRQEDPEPVRTKEPEQKGERRLVLEREAQLPIILMAWHIGAAGDPDQEALERLNAILTRGESSRLYRRLVDEEQVAISVNGFADEGFDPGLTRILVNLTAGTSPDKAESIIDDELAKVVAKGVSAEELTKAKNIFVADFWRDLRTINGKARALGQYEVFHGDYSKLFTAADRYEAVTAEQIQKVAGKVFRKSNRTVGVVVPTTPDADAAGGAQ